MDFSESLMALAAKAMKIRDNLATEEATKTALVLPFIHALGYDVFNPLEVVPEFIADVAGFKNEKVDYAIMHEGKPIMIIECKSWGTKLDEIKREQLHRYFLTLTSSIGILTDGIRYRFYSTSDDGKNMEATPFMEFDLENIDPTLIPELRKLCKGKFDLQTTLETVTELKANRQIKNLLARNLESPEESFVVYLMGQVEEKRATARLRELYTGYTKRAFSEFVAEQIDMRLKSALAATPKKEEVPAQPVADAEPEAKIVTTEEEWQAYYLVKSLLMGSVDPDRVIIRDAQSYCSIFLDSNRKPLIRFHFNNPARLRVELFGEGNARTMHDIAKVEEILRHADTLRATLAMYETAKG